MTVAQLVEHLKTMPQDAVVVTMDTDDGGIDWYYEFSPPQLRTMGRLNQKDSQWHEYYFDPQQPWPDNIPSNVSGPYNAVTVR